MELFFWLPHFPFHEINDLFRLGYGVVLGRRPDDDIVTIEEDH